MHGHLRKLEKDTKTVRVPPHDRFEFFYIIILISHHQASITPKSIRIHSVVLYLHTTHQHQHQHHDSIIQSISNHPISCVTIISRLSLINISVIHPRLFVPPKNYSKRCLESFNQYITALQHNINTKCQTCPEVPFPPKHLNHNHNPNPNHHYHH